MSFLFLGSFVLLYGNKIAQTELVNLKVDDGQNPLGIDSEYPRFSWQMHSSIIGQYQTAYRIAVSKTLYFDEVVWDSGKQIDDRSVGIYYEGTVLNASTKYYWKVTVWDKDEQLVDSDIAWFETGLFRKEEWNFSEWISAPKKRPNEIFEDNLQYVVEAVLSCRDQAIGLLFNVFDDNNFHMFQVNSGQVTQGRVLLRPHAMQNGYFDNFSEQYTVDITDKVGGTENIKTNTFKIKIEVNQSDIKTYINDDLVSAIPSHNIAGIGFFQGKIGIRTNGSETGTVSSLKMTDYTNRQEGDVIYDYSFTDSNPLFKGKIENGVLVVANDNMIYSPESSPVFRKSFAIIPGKIIESGTLYATGLGVFDLFLNNTRVGHKQEDDAYIYDELKPGFTQIGNWPEGTPVLNTEVHYYIYDVTDLLAEGNNALSMLVTSGWWTGAVGGSPGSSTAVRAQVLIKYNDGSSETIGTDTSWKTSSQTSVLMADIWHGETYDATINSDWKKMDYDDTAWGTVVVNNEFSGEINAAPEAARVQVREDLELSTKSITVYDAVENVSASQYGSIRVKAVYAGGKMFTLNPGEKAIVDLGQNFAGWLQIKAEGERGTVLSMRHGEMLNDRNGLISRGNDGPEGSLFTANLHGASATAVYIMSGGGVETYHPLYTFFGFRYVELSTSATVEIQDARGIVLTSVKKETGSLTTSDKDINQLINNIKWGQYSNFISIPTDCPQRAERQGWTGDVQVFSTTAAYLADSKGFLSKWLTDLRNAQLPDGNYPEVAPRGCFRNDGGAGWSDAGIIVPYNLYKMYGDKSIIEKNYASMSKFMNFLSKRGREGGLPIWGDWLGYEGNDDDMKKYIGVVYYAWNAKLMAEMAGLLGKSSDVTKYNHIYEQQKLYFKKEYLKSNGELKRTEQTICLLALKIDLLPDEFSRQKAIDALLTNIKNKGNRLNTGFIGTAIIMQTLSDIGAPDVAYELLFQRKEPSWLYCIDQGATTVWEKWNSYTKEYGFEASKSSFNHYSYGAVAEWMYSYMAGISYDFQPPGFKHIVLQPTPDKRFSSVNCSYESAYGYINSSWKYENDQFSYTAAIPANTTATLTILLNNDDETVYENNKPLDETEGVVAYTINDKVAKIELVSGTYNFTIGKNTYSSIKKLIQQDKFSIYPNPIDDKLNIINQDKNIIEAGLFNLYGKKVYSQNDDAPIDMGAFLSGVYFLKIQDNEGNKEVIKIIKK